MRFDGNAFVFETTGRKFTANFDMIGLSPDGEWVGEGADNGLFNNPQSKYDDGRPLMPEERVELANFMISLWQEFKDKL